MKNKKLKLCINILIILVVLGIVLYFSLKDNYEEIVDSILHMNHFWSFMAVVILCLCRALISLTHYLVIRLNGEKVSFFRCLQINFIILFFHGVTPFAGGGQPMEVYFLHNEKINVTKAANITLQNFIIYQIALVLVGTFAFLYNGIFQLFLSDHFIKKLVVFGFMVNLFVLVFSFVLSFGKRIGHLVCQKGVKILYKLRIIRDFEKVQEKIQVYLDNFYQNALELKKNKKLVVQMVLIDILSLLLLYSMPYLIALGFGKSITLIQAIVTMAYVMIIGSFVPVPGGTGGIEYGFVFFFGYFIKGLNAMMLIWRFISYYLGMILGAIALSLYRKKEKTCE